MSKSMRRLGLAFISAAQVVQLNWEDVSSSSSIKSPRPIKPKLKPLPDDDELEDEESGEESEEDEEDDPKRSEELLPSDH